MKVILNNYVIEGKPEELIEFLSLKEHTKKDQEIRNKIDNKRTYSVESRPEVTRNLK